MDWASLGDVSKEELGSYKIHTRNGAIDDEADSEQQAFEMARRFLSYLPSSADELPPVETCDDDPEREDEALLSIVPKDPRQVYKMHSVLESVCDKGSFFEIGKKWGRSIITGLARLNGIPVAIFAENPRVYGGAWTADAANKLIRLMDLASTFHLPVIHLEDCPGFLIGKQSEEEGTIRAGAAALAAMGQLTTPFCCGRAQGLWRRRRGKPQTRQPSFPRRMAVWRLGIATHRRRYRSGLQSRNRRGQGSRRPLDQNQGATESAALTFSQCRIL